METILTAIENDAEHAYALRIIETLWNSLPGTEEEKLLDSLVDMVEEYEVKRWPIGDVE